MAREIPATRTRSAIHLPKSVTRHGATQRDWIVSRLRAVRRVVIMLSFAVGALFTGLALRHSLHPAAPVEAQTAQPVSQSVQNQPVDVPSQSLFDNQSSNNFSVAPAPQVSTPRIRTVSS